MNWKKFLEVVEQYPQRFAQAVVDFLNPPNYAKEALRKLFLLCNFCWQAREDECGLCGKSVCEKHHGTVIGERTHLEWYICPQCQEKYSATELSERIQSCDQTLLDEVGMEQE